MLSIKQPSLEQIHRSLDEQSRLGLSYEFTNATSGTCEGFDPSFFRIDFNRSLGRGETVFRTAIAGLKQWRCFRLPWTIATFDACPKVGGHIAVAAKACGIWSVNVCRVVAHDPAESDPNQWSFTVGTLPGHMAIGEERISVQLDPDSGQVTYRIHSYSKPNWLFAKLARPLVRRQQARFCVDSFQAMKRFVVANERSPIAHSTAYVSQG